MYCLGCFLFPSFLRLQINIVKPFFYCREGGETPFLMKAMSFIQYLGSAAVI